MLGPGEVAHLSDDEIEGEIRGLLRPGEDFHFFQKRYWYAEVWCEPESLWRNTGFDKRLLLLDAYGWLWARTNPKTSSHLWTSRKQELPKPPPAWQETNSVPDPEDLDPSEVEAVYGKK